MTPGELEESMGKETLEPWHPGAKLTDADFAKLDSRLRAFAANLIGEEPRFPILHEIVACAAENITLLRSTLSARDETIIAKDAEIARLREELIPPVPQSVIIDRVRERIANLSALLTAKDSEIERLTARAETAEAALHDALAEQRSWESFADAERVKQLKIKDEQIHRLTVERDRRGRGFDRQAKELARLKKAGPHLFNVGRFSLHSGEVSDFKIDCDALSDSDIAALAVMIAKRYLFSAVEGVPTGGTRLAEALKPFVTALPVPHLLIVDDVLTTGASMEAHRDGRDAQGLVIFARGACSDWIDALFTAALAQPPAEEGK